MKKNSRSLWRIILALTPMLGACRKQIPAAPPAPPAAHLMVLQPWPYIGGFDLYGLNKDTVRYNSNPILYPGNLFYVDAPAGVRIIVPNLAGTLASSAGIIPELFSPGAYYTLYNIDNILNLSTNQIAFVEDDLSAPASGMAKLRIIQGANYSHRLNWLIHGGDTLAKGLGFRNSYPDITGFIQLPAGGYVFDLSNNDAPYTFQASLQATLAAGKIYTVYSMNLPTPDSVQVKIGMQLITNK